jgi:thioredoxin-dependent peroxiredoxin
MKRILAALSVACALAAIPAHATLALGTIAPDFSTVASLGGRDFDFSLNEALKRGPVVLYFYPAAFTKGCTIEAHEFADATDKFAALGATVIGVSHDNIATLDKFSVSECRSKFAVAADPDATVIRAYDTPLPQNPAMANRTSYVIAPDHKIIMVYTAMDPYQHVDLTLRAVQDWEATHRRQ